ncbi:hypothetical protein AAC387_Pa10g0824 [Persea americana]
MGRSRVYLCNMIKMEEKAIPEENEGESPTEDRMDEVNLGGAEDPRLVLISSSLNGEERDAYVELLKGFNDIFSWNYKEMSGLDPSVAVHYLNIWLESRPHKQSQRKFATDRIEKLEAEVQKLLRVRFIREK